MERKTFFRSRAAEPHGGRARAILKAHPEIRHLIGRNPWTAAVMIFVVAFQVLIAWLFGQLGSEYWWLSLLAAYMIGAFASLCLYTVIHDASHSLIFKRRNLNNLVAMVADLPNLMPAALGFRVYHLKHHSHQGEYDQDADLPSYWEARLVGNRWYAKILWLLFYPVLSITRAWRITSMPFYSVSFALSCIASAVFDIAVYLLCGWNGIIYLLGSFVFSTGLHPLGARWVQEHYTTEPEQETGSYYGLINLVSLNVGHHNEHHDFPSIPWNRLPRVRATAPEFYDSLNSHSSLTRLFVEFIFDPRYSLYSRVVRSAREKLQSV
jgi:sphingolipid 4-desaturase/C4-monooxygenase